MSGFQSNPILNQRITALQSQINNIPVGPVGPTVAPSAYRNDYLVGDGTGAWESGGTSRGTDNIIIGHNSAPTYNGSNSVILGKSAAATISSPNGGNVIIGERACEHAVLNGGNIVIGSQAGPSGGGTLFATSICIGNQCGNAMGDGGICIGFGSSSAGQGGQNSVQIGTFAGATNSGNQSVNLGSEAGRQNAGASSINIGYQSNTTGAAANAITLNATGAAIQNNVANSFVVKPIRTSASVTSAQQSLWYDPVRGEITRNAVSSFGQYRYFQSGFNVSAVAPTGGTPVLIGSLIPFIGGGYKLFCQIQVGTDYVTPITLGWGKITFVLIQGASTLEFITFKQSANNYVTSIVDTGTTACFTFQDVIDTSAWSSGSVRLAMFWENDQAATSNMIVSFEMFSYT